MHYFHLLVPLLAFKSNKFENEYQALFAPYVYEVRMWVCLNFFFFFLELD